MTAIAAIIAGGGAKRLGGQTKGLLVIGGRRIIDRQLEALSACFDRILLVTNDPSPWRHLPPIVTVIGDRVSGGAGPLAGIDAALWALPPDVAAVTCVAGDMPFITRPSLQLLRDHAPDAAAVVPRVGGRAEPLFARYARTLTPLIAAHLARGHRAVHRLLPEAQVVWMEEPLLRAVDPTLRFLENINSPDQLARARTSAP